MVFLPDITLVATKADVFKNVGQLNTVMRNYGSVATGFIRWADKEGRGMFTPLASAGAAFFVRHQLLTGGKELGGFPALSTVTTDWQAANGYSTGSLFNMTGAWMGAIKSLRRREGGVRKMVVGVDRRVYVPHIRHASTDRKIQVAVYAESIEKGTGTQIHARPIMSRSIMKYIGDVFPGAVDIVYKDMQRKIKVVSNQARIAAAKPEEVPENVYVTEEITYKEMLDADMRVSKHANDNDSFYRKQAENRMKELLAKEGLAGDELTAMMAYYKELGQV